MSSKYLPAVYEERFEERAFKELWEVETRHAIYKRYLSEELIVGCLAEGGRKSHGSLFGFACDDHKSDRKENRKRNCYDYYGSILK